MAVFPCDWSGHRYPGPQCSVYVTSIWGADPETVKLRLCQKHFGDLVEIAQIRLALVDEDSQVAFLCEGCGNEKSGCVYVKVFLPKSEPVTYAADFCASCWQKVRQELKVASGRPLAAR